MSEIRRLMDDQDDADIQGIFNAYFDTEQPSPGFDERLMRLVLQEVQAVYGTAPAAPVVAPRPAPRFGAIERLRRWLKALSPGQSLALAGAAAVALFLLVLVLSQLAPRPLTAPAVARGGEVTVLHRQDNTYRTYQDGELFRVGKGDQILTTGGAATVYLFPSQTAEIARDAHVIIDELNAVMDATQVELLVLRGRVDNVIDETLTEGDRYVVTSSVITAAAVGTEFSFEAISPTEVIVITRRGAVEVRREEQTVIVEAGQQVVALNNAPLTVLPGEERPDLPALLVISPDAAGIPVYAEPNVQSRLIGYATGNMLLRVLTTDSMREWYQVCCVAGQVGWLRIDAVPAPPPQEPESNAPPGNRSERERSGNGVVSAPFIWDEPYVAIAFPQPTPTILEAPSPSPTAATSPTAGATPLATSTTAPTQDGTTSVAPVAPTATSTSTSTFTPTPTNTPTDTPTNTLTNTATNTATSVPSTVRPTDRPTDPSPGGQQEPTLEPTPTDTPTPTPTDTPTFTPSPTDTPTPTNTPTFTPSPTDTPTPTNTPTFTPSPTFTTTPTFTPSPTIPGIIQPTDPTQPPEPTPTNTPVPTPTPTFTPTPTPTFTPTNTPVPTPTSTPTPTSAPPTPTPSPTQNPLTPAPKTPITRPSPTPPPPASFNGWERLPTLT